VFRPPLRLIRTVPPRPVRNQWCLRGRIVRVTIIIKTRTDGRVRSGVQRFTGDFRFAILRTYGRDRLFVRTAYRIVFSETVSRRLLENISDNGAKMTKMHTVANVINTEQRFVRCRRATNRCHDRNARIDRSEIAVRSPDGVTRAASESSGSFTGRLRGKAHNVKNCARVTPENMYRYNKNI
jgi:hypothetical protein